ncbi:MAG: TlpA family protein disulfide reductase [Dysgonamonadaceae bacterium]|nr:TlpA family protein disulfide reductase [Dysgonamonadaceae bacterium]
MKNYLFIITAIFFAACSNPPKNEVHLKGQLQDLGVDQIVMSYNGASSLIGKSRDIKLRIDENGYFDTIISLERPEYYSISRNTLYLTPGDDMEILITNDNTEALFSGKGAEANIYLKKRLFPHGGSFLEAGKNVSDNFESTKTLIDSLATIRYAELDTLTGVSELFKELEKARITADLINSYVYYMYYGKESKAIKTRDESKAYFEKFTDAIAEYVNPLYKTITDDKYLDVAVVRDVFSFREDFEKLFEGVETTALNSELYRAAKYADKLDSEPSPENLNEVISALPELSDAFIKRELSIKIDKAQTLQPGQPAFDFAFADTLGQIKHLSDFKGKLVYIDFWATWCGPCIAESPHYESLAEQLADKDIVFLPISVDNTAEVWLKYLGKHEKKLTQYHTSDPDFRTNWNIKFIPRFILIDREQKIINAYAPRPSEAETKELLKALL